MIGSSSVRRPERAGQLEPEVGRRGVDVALGKPEAEDVVGPERADADPGDDAGVHAS